MKVTVHTKAGKVVARSGNRQKTIRSTGHVGMDHAKAANALVSKNVPGYRNKEILNSVRCTEALRTKTVFVYKD